MSWLGVVVVLILGSSMLSSGLIKQRASQLLTKEQDSQVFAIRARRTLIRTFLSLYYAFAIVILAALGVGVRPPFVLLVIGAACLAVWAHISYFRSLRALDLPPAYVASIRRARLITYSGVLAV